MTLAELNDAIVGLLLDKSVKKDRAVKVVLMDEDGNRRLILDIEELGLVHEWTETSSGRQLQYKVAIICGADMSALKDSPAN